MKTEVKRNYNRDEKGKFTKKAPTEEPKNFDIHAIENAVRECSAIFIVDARLAMVNDLGTIGTLLTISGDLTEEVNEGYKIAFSLSRINMSPIYKVDSALITPDAIYELYTFNIVSKYMTIDETMYACVQNAVDTAICTLAVLLDIDIPEADNEDDDDEERCCDECEMECPCRSGYHLSLSLDDFDDIAASDYDDIDGTEIYGIVDDMFMTGSDYAQTTMALLGVKNQYTVILYGKNTVADKIVIKCTMLASDNVTMQVNRYGVAYTIPCDNVLSDNVMKICAKHGYDLIHNMLELVKEHDDEIVDGSIMAAESADEIEDRICNNPDFAE